MSTHNRASISLLHAPASDGSSRWALNSAELHSAARAGEDTSMTKPHLIVAKQPTAQDIAKLFKRVTGREPSEREMREIERELAPKPSLTCHRASRGWRQ